MEMKNSCDNPKDCTCTQPEREPMVNEVLGVACALVERAESLRDRAHLKLAPVMRVIPPCGEAGCASKSLERARPPLFEELIAQFSAIAHALNGVEDALDRTEL